MTRQEELEGSSEFELNCKVARILGYRVSQGSTTDEIICDSRWSKDYCNNPADIMPLVVGLDITITFNTIDHNEREGAFVRYNKRPLPPYEAFNENPYRALAIVLILIKETEL